MEGEGVLVWLSEEEWGLLRGLPRQCTKEVLLYPEEYQAVLKLVDQMDDSPAVPHRLVETAWGVPGIECLVGWRV